MSQDWSIPVYREGYTDPFSSDNRQYRESPYYRGDPPGPPGPPGPPMSGAMVPYSGGEWWMEPQRSWDVGQRWMDQAMQQHHRTWQHMNREMERLFPWFPPGEFRPGIEPSALAPREDNANYIVEVNASNYQPNEITVKTANRGGYNFLVVEGKHQTSDASGYHSVHHFRRQFMIPPDVDPETFSSRLTPTGTLVIQAPKRSKVMTGERRIPIQR